MGRNEIIADLFNSKEFKNCIAKMKPEHLQSDLVGEVMLILCEEEEEKIINLHGRGVLKFYTVRIILNLIQSTTSPFYKKFRRNDLIMNMADGKAEGRHVQMDLEFMNRDSQERMADEFGFTDQEDYSRLEKQLKECLALDEIDNLYWYDREIVRLYLKLGTYRAVEEETGIPFESIYKTVKKACKQIKAKVA